MSAVPGVPPPVFSQIGSAALGPTVWGATPLVLGGSVWGPLGVAGWGKLSLQSLCIRNEKNQLPVLSPYQLLSKQFIENVGQFNNLTTCLIIF